MCCAASFWIVSASSWSLIDGSEIFFTITECPLTAVATALDLISVVANSLEIALDTGPESTIIESTTISGAIGSSPRCTTSIPVRVFLSSTALMLDEPTSRPTIVFVPNPNMCPPFVAPAARRQLSYCCPAAFIAALIFFCACDSVSADFSSIHWSSFDFLNRQRFPSLNAGIFCSFTYLYKVSGLTPRYCEAWRMFITSRDSAIACSSCTELISQRFFSPTIEEVPKPSPRYKSRSSEFWCAEHISTGTTGLSNGISRFYWVLWGFFGIGSGRSFASNPIYCYSIGIYHFQLYFGGISR